MIKTVMPLIGKYKKPSILTSVFVMGEVFLEVLIPYFLSKIIDVGIKSGDMAYVLRTGALMIFMATLSLLLGALSGRFAAVAGMGFAKNIRESLFDKVLNFSFSNADRFSTSSLITRLTTDVVNLQNIFTMIIRMLVRSPVMLISATSMAVFINKELSLVFFVAMPVLAGALFLVSSRAHPLFLKMLKKYDKMNLKVQENLTGIRVVKAFVREDYETKTFMETSLNLKNSQVKAEKYVVTIMPLMQFVMYGCTIAITWFGGIHIIDGRMQTGELISFLSYVMQILISLMMISMAFVMAVMSKASLSRIVEVLNEEPDIAEGEGDDFVSDGSILFENVTFSYSKNNENPVLKDISFSIKSGETVGIIGGTGSAKTTLVSLIPRLYDRTGGRILVGGRDVKDYKFNELRRAVSMVLQKNVLFSGTIMENLKWGDQEATYDEIVEACKISQAHEFVSSSAKGYETVLEQGGVNLSGGQRQRLCIARALIKKPKILIMDDSTSAIDTATDKKLRAALKAQKRDMTTIIIAQRIASVRDADKIIVLDDGQLSDIGTHEYLVENNEIYKEVYTSQHKGAL